jgi:hypothetical protein
LPAAQAVPLDAPSEDAAKPRVRVFKLGDL